MAIRHAHGAAGKALSPSPKGSASPTPAATPSASARSKADEREGRRGPADLRPKAPTEITTKSGGRGLSAGPRPTTTAAGRFPALQTSYKATVSPVHQADVASQAVSSPVQGRPASTTRKRLTTKEPTNSTAGAY